MFSPMASRSAAAYKRASIESSVEMADPHQLVTLLFDALARSIGSAKLTLQAGDIPGKCKHIGNAISILEEGLRAPLDLERGGEIAHNLNRLYEYCVKRLIDANLQNDVAALDEVTQVLEPVVSGWKQIRDDVAQAN